MFLPKLRPARKCVSFLYDYVLAGENEGDFFPERPLPARRLYLLWVNVGRGVYAPESDGA